MYHLLPVLPRQSIRVPASLSAGLQAPRALPPLMRRGSASYYVVRPGDDVWAILNSFGFRSIAALQRLVGANPRKALVAGRTAQGKAYWQFQKLDPGELLLIPPAFFARGSALAGVGRLTTCDVPPGDRATTDQLRRWFDTGGAAGVGAPWRFADPVDFGLPAQLRGLPIEQVARLAGLRPREGFSLAWRFTAPFVEARHDRAGQDAPGGGVLGRLGNAVLGEDADGDGEDDEFGSCGDGFLYNPFMGRCVFMDEGDPCAFTGPDGSRYEGTWDSYGNCPKVSGPTDQPPPDCGPGYVWNATQQACLPVECPPGTHYNPNTDDCSPDSPCEKGYHLDPQKGCLPDGGGPAVPPIPPVPPIKPGPPDQPPPVTPTDKPTPTGTGMLDRLKAWLMSPTAKKVGAALAIVAVIYAATGGGMKGGGKRRGGSRRRVSRRRR